jgi:hypothetical protein
MPMPADADAHGSWLQGWKTIARGASYQGLILARLSMPSFLSSKRSRLITAAVASALTAATVATAAAAARPSGSAASAASADARLLAVAQQQAPAHGDALTAAQRMVAFDEVRFSLGGRQLQHDVAAAKAAAAKAAAAKTAAAKAAAAKAAAKQMAASTPTGTPEQIAQQMLSKYGWSSSQMSCLYPLWYHESGWNPSAQNPGSGAYGIPQSLPGSQMASAGADWATNPATQIKWGLTYIQGRYGSPCGAWAHEQANNWY